MSEPRELVEHFFRHEFGRLVAVLTRSLGVRRLDLAEDVVQAALMQALQTGSRRGVPEDTAGWLWPTRRGQETRAEGGAGVGLGDRMPQQFATFAVPQ
jgi:RNA polymerase sigma-70 factor (ECF subfamily)